MCAIIYAHVYICRNVYGYIHVSIERYTYLQISPLRMKHGASRTLGRFFPTQPRVWAEKSSACTVQADLGLSILLPQFPQSWDDQTAEHTWFWGQVPSYKTTQFTSLSYTVQNCWPKHRECTLFSSAGRDGRADHLHDQGNSQKHGGTHLGAMGLQQDSETRKPRWLLFSF